MGEQSTSLRSTVLHPFLAVLHLSLSRSPKRAPSQQLRKRKKGKFFFSFIKSGFHQMDATAGFISNQIILHRSY